MPGQFGRFMLAASLLVLFVAAFLFVTGSLVPWSNSCPSQSGVDPTDDVPVDAEIVTYESLTPAKQAALDGVLASDSMASLDDWPWSSGPSYVRKNGMVYDATTAVCWPAEDNSSSTHVTNYTAFSLAGWNPRR